MLSFIAATFASFFEAPKPERTPEFDTVDGFVTYLVDNGGSVADDSLTDAEFEIAEQAGRAGLVKHHETTWGASGWYYLVPALKGYQTGYVLRVRD